jgi:hypothetical protein
MNIKNKIVLMWSVEDPVYPYQSNYQYTVEEFNQLNMEELREQQQLEYADWFATMQSMEQGQ